MENNEISGRATEIETGAIPLSQGTVALNVPRNPIIESRGSASAAQWTLNELLSQWKLVDTIPINNSSSGEIWKFRHTWRNVYELHFRSFKLLFPIKSWKIQFLIQFRSNFQQVGMFTLAFTNIPLPLQSYLIGENSNKTDSRISEFSLLTQLPHTFIFMGEDHDVTAELDWNAPFSSSIDSFFYPFSKNSPMLDQENYHDDYDMGSLMLHVTHKMQTVADDNMSVRIWSRLSDLTYAGYNPSDDLL